MLGKISPGEEAQLAQTIEMFEVITQSQPNDYQSLEILKEAYLKLGYDGEVANTSKRIAQAYVQMGQLSSAILEYETILQRFPDDPDVKEALREIESRADNYQIAPPAPDTTHLAKAAIAPLKEANPSNKTISVEDGRQAMQKLFVESKTITMGDFDLCWSVPDMTRAPSGVADPFIQVLADKGILPIDRSLKLLSDKSRMAFMPLDLYEVDLELARTFPAAACRRWCVLPFDRMSKSVLVATANPFNLQVAKDLAAATGQRLLWYLAPPVELVTNLRKAFR